MSEHLEEVFSELPESEQKRIEQHARRKGCSRLEYLGELLEKDLANQSAEMRKLSTQYRFARDEDFGMKTFLEWLKNRRT